MLSLERRVLPSAAKRLYEIPGESVFGRDATGIAGWNSEDITCRACRDAIAEEVRKFFALLEKHILILTDACPATKLDGYGKETVDVVLPKGTVFRFQSRESKVGGHP